MYLALDCETDTKNGAEVVTEVAVIGDAIERTWEPNDSATDLRDILGVLAGRIVLAYNAPSDIGILRRWCTRQRVRFLVPKSVCLMKEVRGRYPRFTSYRLKNVCRSLGISIAGVKFHEADSDARMAWEVWQKVGRYARYGRKRM